ncbi:MAG: hypothetical protein L6Q49_16475 [Anaerolineales bacterium]|nr:hypothetical protein [Anaerolineales bacterium]
MLGGESIRHPGRKHERRTDRYRAAPPRGGAPQNVSLQKWDIACNYETNQANVTIRWADKEDETGYRVVRNDVVVAELPADSTEYFDTITLLSGQTVAYRVIAFNPAGDASSKTISMGC